MKIELKTFSTFRAIDVRSFFFRNLFFEVNKSKGKFTFFLRNMCIHLKVLHEGTFSYFFSTSAIHFCWFYLNDTRTVTKISEYMT